MKMQHTIAVFNNGMFIELDANKNNTNMKNMKTLTIVKLKHWNSTVQGMVKAQAGFVEDFDQEVWLCREMFSYTISS